MANDLTIIITVRESADGSYSDIEVSKPSTMNMAEVIGRLEQAKNDLVNGGTVKEHSTDS